MHDIVTTENGLYTNCEKVYKEYAKMYEKGRYVV